MKSIWSEGWDPDTTEVHWEERERELAAEREPEEPSEGPWTTPGYLEGLVQAGRHQAPDHGGLMGKDRQENERQEREGQGRPRSSTYITGCGWVAEAGRTHGDDARRRHWIDRVDGSALYCTVYTTACGLRVLSTRQGGATAYCASCARAKGRGVPQ